MKKISVKTFYLIAVISIGLIGLAVGSTYAMFTTSAEINNPITISSNLTSNNDAMETFEVEVKSKEFITKTIIVNSGNNTNINYGIWYLNDITDIEIGVKSTTNNEISGTITNSNTSRTIEIAIKNKSAEKKTITIGVATSKNSIILSSNMSLIPKKVVEAFAPLSTTITNLYNNSTKTPVTNNSITYQYDTTNSLMKDVGNNIRYYGASPNNYIYFNCSDYSNQSSSTCETWRIIGVFDGKAKIIRNSQIGAYSWDTTASTTNSGYGANDWSTSKLMMLLNEGYNYMINNLKSPASLYWNSSKGSCYNAENLGIGSCNFTSTGLKNNTTKNMISETTYYLGGWNDSILYPNEIYEYERGTTVYSGRPTTWTGKIALAYPSDYGYAADLSKCNVQLSIYFYNNSTCTSNNWVHSIIGNNTSNYGWLLTSNSDTPDAAWFIHPSGGIDNHATSSAIMVIPVLYLNPELFINSGTGSSSDPYQLLV